MRSRRTLRMWTAWLAFSGTLPATAAFTPPPPQETALHSPSPGFFGQYGEAVAIDGATLLVGAPMEGTGAAYVYQRVEGIWRLQARLVPEDPESTLDFGGAVALWGDTAVVGAPREGEVEGAVYVFVRQGGTWEQQARLTSAAAAREDQLGFSVALYGNELIVGIPWADDRGKDSGAAEVYVRNGGSWVRQARLTAPGSRDGDLFGFAVDHLHGWAVVGAPQQRQEAGPRTGAAHVFFSTSGTWRHLAELRADDAAALDGFGFSVATSGNHVIVGALFADPGGVMDAGAAYVFEPQTSGVNWRQVAKLVDSTPAPHDGFGFAVGVAGFTAAVGAWRDDARGGDAGWVHLFGRLPEGAWVGQGSLVSSDIQAQDRFGAALDISNGVIVAGAFRAHDQGVSRAGQAYVFELAVARLRLIVEPARQTVASGADASFILNVRNIGNVRLRNLRVTVPGAPACTFSLAPLGVGVRRRVRCEIQDVTEDFRSVVSARGIPLVGFPVNASAEVEITVEEPE